ncbi:MAG TPA: hypothetical protein VHG08_03495 [Longimicrobium sp.]|nr:hypothetical protein [Longimicrobium sp.]
MPRIRIPRPFAAITFAAVVACTSNPLGLCACDPPIPTAVVYGRVTQPDGVPAGGARVHVDMSPTGCEKWVDGRDYNTDGEGRYRASLYRLGPESEQCVRVFAEPLVRSAMRGSDTVTISVHFPANARPDSVRVDLALRPLQ